MAKFGYWTILVCCLLSQSQCKLAMLHYGHFGGLQLRCEKNELIMIESQVLGYSEDAPDCNPTPQCSRSYTLGKWYCRGKRGSCSGMQVERWPLLGGGCKSSFTNCLRIEYYCVSGK